MIAKTGTVMCIESGVYDDYRHHGLYRVLIDHDPIAKLAEYSASLDPEDRDDIHSDFGDWLHDNGIAEEISSQSTLYLGQYGTGTATFTANYMPPTEK